MLRFNKAKKGPSTAASLRVLFELLVGFRLEYSSLVFVSSLMSALEGLLHPLLIKSIFDEGVIKGGFRKFLILVISYLALGLFLNLVNTGAALWGKSLENRLVKIMSQRMLESYYKTEYASVLRNGHGYFINRV